VRRSENLKDEEAKLAFGKQVKKYREAAGLSQESLAIKCDMANSQISRIETGAVNTSLVHICAIARELNVELKDLMDFRVSKKKKANA
jgi:transcriptional regulator with XRE-family HTH domain